MAAWQVRARPPGAIPTRCAAPPGQRHACPSHARPPGRPHAAGRCRSAPHGGRGRMRFPVPHRADPHAVLHVGGQARSLQHLERVVLRAVGERDNARAGVVRGIESGLGIRRCLELAKGVQHSIQGRLVSLHLERARDHAQARLRHDREGPEDSAQIQRECIAQQLCKELGQRVPGEAGALHRCVDRVQWPQRLQHAESDHLGERGRAAHGFLWNLIRGSHGVRPCGVPGACAAELRTGNRCTSGATASRPGCPCRCPG